MKMGILCFSGFFHFFFPPPPFFFLVEFYFFLSFLFFSFFFANNQENKFGGIKNSPMIVERQDFGRVQKAVGKKVSSGFFQNVISRRRFKGRKRGRRRRRRKKVRKKER